MKRAEHSSAFSALASAKAKILFLGPSGPPFADLVNQGCSLNLEHVSPALLVQQEISRRSPSGRSASPPNTAAFTRGSAACDQHSFALLRKWFWARKPDAGFLLEGFPATLLQALVFDEWLETRGENLTAVFTALHSSLAPATQEIVTHYRTLGLLLEAIPAAVNLSLSEV